MPQRNRHPTTSPTVRRPGSTAAAEDIADDVAAAAARLDQRMPGWWRHVDIDLLDQGSLRHDVLGQLCGDYATGLARLGLRLTATDQRGFTLSPRQAARALGSTRRLHALFAEHTTAWAALIRSRHTRRHPIEPAPQDNRTA